MIYTLSRPPTDDHTFFMFRKLMEEAQLPADHQIYYMWSNPPDRVISFLDSTQFTSPLVILGIKDLLDGWAEFNFWHDKIEVIPERISDVAKIHPQTNFILFTSLENLDLELVEPNVHIVPWGGDLVNQKVPYQKLEPVLNKNFNSDKSFICLNRNRRDHRIVTLSYLLGKEYNKHGYISYLSNNTDSAEFQPTNFLDRICWEFDYERHDQIKDIMLNGYKLLLELEQPEADNYEIYAFYHRKTNDNFTNFNAHLRQRYQNSFVEIVSESSFCAPAFNITEKTANAFFGCNFPILLSGCGIVQHLRGLGLDLFDDVVDQSYDNIANPFDRIVAAIDRNERLLKDADYAKQKWKECQGRFESNYKIIRNVYDWYDARTRSKFTEIIQKIC